MDDESYMKQDINNMMPLSCSDDTYPKGARDLLIFNSADDTTRTKMKHSSSQKIYYKDLQLDKHSKGDSTTSLKQPCFSDSKRDEKSIDSQSSPDLIYGSMCYKKMMAALAENLRLRQLLKDVTEVNRRWQKYNQDRQDYVQQLLSTIENLELELRQQPKNLSVEKVRRHVTLSARHSDTDLLDPSGELAMLRKAHDFCIKENATLHKRNEEIRQNFKKLAQHHEVLLNKVKDQEDNKLLFQAMQPERDYLPDTRDSNSDRNNAMAIKTDSRCSPSVSATKDSGFIKKTCRVAFNDSHESIPPLTSTSDEMKCPICDTSFQTAKYADFLLHYESCLNRTSSETVKHNF